MGAYVLPIVGTLFIGPEGIVIRRGAPITSIPKSVATTSGPFLENRLRLRACS